MAQPSEAYKQGFKMCSSPWECSVKESSTQHLDFDGTSMEFFEGQYTMGPMISKCLVRKYAHYQYYTLMKNFWHSNVIKFENFYDELGLPRCILSWIDGSLIAWVKEGPHGKMFSTSVKGTRPTGVLRQTILDLCSGLETLMKEQLYPLKIEVHDMYVRKQGDRGIPLLCINAVERLEDSVGIARKEKLWGDVKRAVYDLFGKPPRGIDPITKRFIEYIGATNVDTLRGFPDVWDYKMKARYLLYVMSVDRSIVEPLVRRAGIKWPRAGSGYLRSPFQAVINHELKSGAEYFMTAYDYLRLCKNVIKHWVAMPSSVKAECDSWKRFIDRIERWDPLFWCTLYAATAEIFLRKEDVKKGTTGVPDQASGSSKT